MDLRSKHVVQRAWPPALALVLLLQSGGCISSCFPTATTKFQLVDAQTRQPLEGVAVSKNSTNRHIMAIPFNAGRDGTYALPATGADGLVEAKGLCNNQQHRFLFRKAGYRDATAKWAAGGDGVFIDLPPTDPHHTHRGQYVSDRGVVALPMYPDERLMERENTSDTRPSPGG